MSRLHKMSIQGIRSFGNRDQDTQVITFFTPLTVIVGPNGSGKTTIIECLKYMSTGIMPPGAKTGGAFVHDPKVAHDTEVRGQIRLLFQDVTGHNVQVQRTLVATQKVKSISRGCLSISLSSLENEHQSENTGRSDHPWRNQWWTHSNHIEMCGTGSRNGHCVRCFHRHPGECHLLSSRRIELVSRHDVDSHHLTDRSRPLSEGKQLKDKFDDIFAATKYMKALEAIRKIRTEKVGFFIPA